MAIKTAANLSIAILATLLFVNCSGTLANKPVVSIRLADISPKDKSATAVLIIRMEKSDLNRELTVGCKSATTGLERYGSMTFLEGSRDSRQEIAPFEFRLADAGEYACGAVLHRSDGIFKDFTRFFLSRQTKRR